MKIRAATLVLLIGYLALPTFSHDHPKAAMQRSNVDATKYAFIANHGQWDGPFAYKAEVGPLALFMEERALTWSLLQEDFAEILHDAGHSMDAAPMFRGHAWRVHFVDQEATTLEAGKQAEHYNNYFLGSDPEGWRPRVPLHEEVAYRGLWQGVDMRVHLDKGRFKYDMIVASKADAARIGMRYEGVDDLRIDDEGRLLFRTSVGDVVEEKPIAWYADGTQDAVDCRYVLKNDVLGFELVGADSDRPIIIDPTLIASTLSGSTVTNYGHCATYDNEGNIYTGAISFGQGYPTNSGSFQQAFGGGGTDIAVSRLSPDGTSLAFATYLGGSSGEYPHSIIVDEDLNLWVFGTTDAANYPVTPDAYDPTHNGGVDIVVTKVAPTGDALVGSTFLGGSANDGRNGFTSNYGDNYRGEIVLDLEGNAYVSSCSLSPNFPTSADAFQSSSGGGQDGVVFSLDPTLSLLRFSTYLGGSSGDMAFGLKVRTDGSVVVGGGTASTNFPTTAGVVQPMIAGNNDAFVAILSPMGDAIQASTFWGTPSTNVAFFLDLDTDENVYIYGQTGTDVPIEPAGTYGISGGGNFIAEFTSDLSATVFTSTIGPGSVVPVAFLVDLCSNIYISGYSAPSGLPVTSDALYNSGGFYLAVFQPDMSGLLYGTYYIGANHVDGGTSRFDKNGVIYQGVCTSGGLPLTPDAYGTTQASWDIGIFKIDMEQAGVQANIGLNNGFGCVPAEMVMSALGNAPNYIWYPGDGSGPFEGNTLTHLYTEAGTYTVMLIGWDSTACNSSDTAYISLPIYEPGQLVASFTAEPISSCDGYGVQLTNTSTDGISILWDFGDGTGSSQIDPLHPYMNPGTYDVTLTVSGVNCQIPGSTTTTVVVPQATIGLDLASPMVICEGGFVQLNAGLGFDSYQWSTGETAAIIDVFEPGEYDVVVMDGFCQGTDTILVLAAPVPEPMSDVNTCPGYPAVLSPGFAVGSILWNTGSSDPVISTDEGGLYWFTATDELGCIVRDTVEVFILPSTEAMGFIPNVFTPNNDGKNDRFQVDGLGLQNFTMQVYNRWGQVMYESSNVQYGWNGGLDNSSDKVPEGTYYYIITYKDLCSTEPETKKAGHVTLLR